MNNLETFLRLGGLLHFGILFANALVPRALGWKKNLAPLSPFLRSMFWVYGVFIVMTIIAFGLLTMLFSKEMAAGIPLARGVCAFVGIFWGARLAVQFFVYDAQPFLTNWFYKFGYHALTVVFTYLAIVYSIAAFR